MHLDAHKAGLIFSQDRHAQAHTDTDTEVSCTFPVPIVFFFSAPIYSTDLGPGVIKRRWEATSRNAALALAEAHPS